MKTMSERLVRCPSCGTTNRLPDTAAGRKVVCGKCKTPLVEPAGPVHVTDATFAEAVERSPLPVLLDLWADWCGPCHMIAPTIDQLSIELDGRVKVAKLNIDAAGDEVAALGKTKLQVRCEPLGLQRITSDGQLGQHIAQPRMAR